ncbi:hypothetical protein K488DRAFT_89046 [Vararia minispora EC-137]|uniref:Uncharacterized protein n=1 Tax=Vararia minispora EC-137 TaxID=1314806 RepID=A0ACB8QBA6_9AGAM|nr:hypothetical protein K488DRAFT_89046 [Vararia minispora EC-137]
MVLPWPPGSRRNSISIGRAARAESDTPAHRAFPARRASAPNPPAPLERRPNAHRLRAHAPLCKMGVRAGSRARDRERDVMYDAWRHFGPDAAGHCRAVHPPGLEWALEGQSESALPSRARERAALARARWRAGGVGQFSSRSRKDGVRAWAWTPTKCVRRGRGGGAVCVLRLLRPRPFALRFVFVFVSAESSAPKLARGRVPVPVARARVRGGRVLRLRTPAERSQLPMRAGGTAAPSDFREREHTHKRKPRPRLHRRRRHSKRLDRAAPNGGNGEVDGMTPRKVEFDDDAETSSLSRWQISSPPSRLTYDS